MTLLILKIISKTQIYDFSGSANPSKQNQTPVFQSKNQIFALLIIIVPTWEFFVSTNGFRDARKKRGAK
jgi:hypothetical protein